MQMKTVAKKKTHKTSSGNWSKALIKKSPSISRGTGLDYDGKDIKPFDFVAGILNSIDAEPFMEQANAECRDEQFCGYLIQSPLAKAWKNLEYNLLNTIKRHKSPITLKDRVRHQTIKIFPQGGKGLDAPKDSPIKNYPTFLVTYHENGNDTNKVEYDYFQISAEQRAWIALNLIEKFA